MKAIRYHAYGDPPRIEDLEPPVIGPDDVLVQVAAATLNPLDIKLHSGARQSYFPLDFPYIMGSVLAGTVERVGAAVDGLRPGDRVIGRRAPVLGGAFAQFAAVPAADCFPLPAAMSFSTGAGIPTAAGTAWLALFGTARLRRGQSVLVHAGAGGVGSFAVQFAKAAGAEVFATASGDGLDIVRRLGADHVIDYRAQPFETVVEGLDVVLDTVGFDTLDRSFGILKRGGHLVSAVMEPDEAKARAAAVSISRIHYRLEPGGMTSICSKIVDLDLEVLIDCEIPFVDFNQAIARQASGRARGKVVLVDI